MLTLFLQCAGCGSRSSSPPVPTDFEIQITKGALKPGGTAQHLIIRATGAGMRRSDDFRAFTTDSASFTVDARGVSAVWRAVVAGGLLDDPAGASRDAYDGTYMAIYVHASGRDHLLRLRNTSTASARRVLEAVNDHVPERFGIAPIPEVDRH